LGKHFSACLLAITRRQAFAALENPGGLLSRRVGADRPGAWL